MINNPLINNLLGTVTQATKPTRYRLALVNIHALSRVNIFQKSQVAVEFCRTTFARMSPSFSYGGAAELFGADDPLQLPRALSS